MRENPGMEGTFRVDAKGAQVKFACPADAVGLPPRWGGQVWTARKFTMRWLVANSALGHGQTDHRLAALP